MLQFETKKFQWITITSLLHLLGFYDERSHPHLIHYTQQLSFELSHELESCDSYSHWAIFILTFLPQSPAKSDYIKNLLYKNSENLEYLEFLREKLNVPEYHIHEARAQYYLDRKEYHKAFVQLMNGKIYERAHEVLMEIAPQFVLHSDSEEQLDNLEKCLEGFGENKYRVLQWSSNGGILMTYLSHRRQVLKTLSEHFLDSDSGIVNEEAMISSKDLTVKTVELILIENQNLISSFKKFGLFEKSSSSSFLAMKHHLQREVSFWNIKLLSIIANFNPSNRCEFPTSSLFEQEGLTQSDKTELTQIFVHSAYMQHVSRGLNK